MIEKQIKVLLIEDNPGDVRLIREMLDGTQGAQFKMESACHLDAGLERLGRGGIDVVLLDLGLPDSQGLNSFVKVNSKEQRVPIVVLTGLEDETLGLNAVHIGSQDYLIKGQLDKSVLVRAIRYAIERKKAEQSLKQSYERLRRILNETVIALASTIEKKDPYTAGHQQRVANLACAIAHEMALSREVIDGLHMAAAIHDIGKIVIPTEILSKPTHLNENEFSIIRTHSQVGYEILNTIEFSRPVDKIVLQHHERMDGTGYPSGLKGKDLLLEAKILAVSDVVEAMSSHRPYRPALGIDKALNEISKKKGILYDSKVVDTCLRLFIEHKFQFE